MSPFTSFNADLMSVSLVAFGYAIHQLHAAHPHTGHLDEFDPRARFYVFFWPVGHRWQNFSRPDEFASLQNYRRQLRWAWFAALVALVVCALAPFDFFL